ncbi:MAG: hypothetical protein ABGY09_03710, partial [Euryarchaeota archaeon]
LNGKFEGPIVSLPEPEYRRVLQSKGFDPWWKLSERYPDRSDLVRTWREAVQTLESVDAELLALLREGRVDKDLDALLRRLAETAVDEAGLNSLIKYWDANAAALSIQRFASVSNTVYAEVVVRFSRLIENMTNKTSELEEEIKRVGEEILSIKSDINSLRERISGIDGKVSLMRKDLESLVDRLSHLENKIKLVEERLNIQGKARNNQDTNPEVRTSRDDHGEKGPVHAIAPLVLIPWGLCSCRWRRGSSCGC